LTIDSRTTVSYVETTLSELDDYMTSIDNNVTAFNEFVRLQLGYLTAPAIEFNTYMKQRKKQL